MDSKQAENLVLYDWFSFTSKKHSPEQLMQALGLTHVPWSEAKGARGYQDRKYFSAISIHYNGRDDMGVWVEMSGQGCRTFESLSTLSEDNEQKWASLFSFIRENNLNLTRLDVAYDDHTGVLDLGDLVRDTQTGMYISKSDYWELVLSSKGTTIQIGSPQSKVLIRIYDKARERNCDPDEHWIRCELQLRDDRASQFTKINLPIGEAFSGVILNYLRYVEPADDANKWRWPMTDYWMRFIEDAQRISIYCAPGMIYNEERCRKYVINQAGNAIDALIRMYGVDDFMELLSSRQTKQNPKYDMLVKEHQAKLDAFARRVKNIMDL